MTSIFGGKIVVSKPKTDRATLYQKIESQLIYGENQKAELEKKLQEANSTLDDLKNKKKIDFAWTGFAIGIIVGITIGSTIGYFVSKKLRFIRDMEIIRAFRLLIPFPLSIEDSSHYLSWTSH